MRGVVDDCVWNYVVRYPGAKNERYNGFDNTTVVEVKNVKALAQYSNLKKHSIASHATF